MKSFKIFMSVLALAVVMAACTKEQQNESSLPVDKGITKVSVGTEGDNYVKLYAGQNIYVGDVYFTEKTTLEGIRYLEVCYTINEPWLMTQLHFDIKDIPVNKQGLPQIGNFDVNEAFDPGVSGYCFEIILGEAGLECNVIYPAAAHAVVVNQNDFSSQTAWGEGELFRKNGSWAQKFNITLDCTDNGFCFQEETAFGGNSKDNSAPWWYWFDTQGPATQKIYAGQTIEVGTITLEGNTFTINLTDGWMLDNVNEPVKYMGYSVLPGSRPAAGLFPEANKGTFLTFDVDPLLQYYVIHLDVRKQVPCQ